MARLVDERGRIAFGLYPEPVEEINFSDFDLRTVMDRRRSGLARRYRFNRFQFVSVMGPDWLFGLAVVDLRLVSSGFCYLYDFRSGEMYEHSLLQPLAFRTRFDARPESGVTRFRKGRFRVEIEPFDRGRRVCVSGPGPIRADLTFRADDHPLRLACPAGYNGWVFTRKSAGLPVTGGVRWGDREWACDPAMRATIDWSCGFMRRETAWNWACLAGILGDGRALGLNLAAGVNETGMTENALWLDGECIKLDAARFEFDRYRPDAPWRVTTGDGRIDLQFLPSAVRQEKLNALVLASNFRQYAGTFTGIVRDTEGNSIAIAGLRGLMEDHFARW